ncbi:MAG: MqnA/MqnD/SBP family protein [Candidatus Methylomirabilales bacterium]
MAQTIRLAHSPDADDAFMFFGLATGAVRDPDFGFVHVLEDIQSLNERALRGEYEVTALSFHAYAHAADRYVLLPHGASMGEAYGPVLVAKRPLAPPELHGKPVAVPGPLTTAALLLRLWDASLTHLPTPFDRILDVVQRGEVEAGLLIHEGQVTYPALGLHKIVDLGEWWAAQTSGLPLPLGGNGIRRDLGTPAMRRISQVLHESIRYGLAHRPDALQHAMRYARGVAAPLVDRFVGMYVNDLTLGYGERGRAAVARLLAMGFEAGILPRKIVPEFVE